MSRLIDAEIAYDKIAEQETSYYMDMEGVQAGLDETPTVDAVQVVRCGECKYYDEKDHNCLDEMAYARCWMPMDFCSFGERREDGNKQRQ